MVDKWSIIFGLSDVGWRWYIWVSNLTLLVFTAVKTKYCLISRYADEQKSSWHFLQILWSSVRIINHGCHDRAWSLIEWLYYFCIKVRKLGFRHTSGLNKQRFCWYNTIHRRVIKLVRDSALGKFLLLEVLQSFPLIKDLFCYHHLGFVGYLFLPIKEHNLYYWANRVIKNKPI